TNNPNSVAGWTNRTPTETGGYDPGFNSPPSYGAGGNGVWDPTTNTILRFDGITMNRWTPSTNTWSNPPLFNEGSYGCGLPYNTPSAVDSKRSQMYTVGSGFWLRWDLTNLAAGPTALSPTGCGNILTQGGPGFDYDSSADRFVGWWSGNDVIVYNPATNTCTT